MVVLGSDDLALMLFDFGSRGLEDFHIYDVVAAVAVSEKVQKMSDQ